MHGNVAPAQCLEVFSLRVASWKLLRYVFHWKLCWLIPPLSRAVGSKVEVHGDLEITALPPPSRRFAVKGRFCSKGHFCLSVSLKACAKVSCSVTKGEEAGHLSVKLKHTRHFPQFYLLFAKRPRGFSTWPLEHFLISEWMWDAVTSCNGLNFEIWACSEATRPPDIRPDYLTSGFDSQPAGTAISLQCVSGIICKSLTESLFVAAQSIWKSFPVLSVAVDC